MINNRNRGYTLIELIIAVGLFALVMTLASGAYLMMININRQAQGITSGIDNVSFAIEMMTRTIRTGTNYGCLSAGVDCLGGGTTFSVKDPSGNTISYSNVGGAIMQTTSTGSVPLTDSSITIDPNGLKFYLTGSQSFSGSGGTDRQQPNVIILISGSVSAGPNKTIPFTVETSATMRGSDL
ncbi:MAG: hypothetical protein RLZZ26_63 [Candidatus Parcubacteria bacterium]|jgi:prepilin-type N-terminal cleavage/methylation domain-containing protein